MYLHICTGVFAVLGCIVILYFNIGVPNELRGFFFYAQVSNYGDTKHAHDVADSTEAAHGVYDMHAYVTTL